MYTTRSPNRSPKLPAPRTSPARVAMKTTITHCTVCRSVEKAVRMEGRATFTEMSRAARNMPSPAKRAVRAARQLPIRSPPSIPSGPLCAFTVTDCKPWGRQKAWAVFVGGAMAYKAAWTVRRAESGPVPSKMTNHSETTAGLKAWIPAFSGMTGAKVESETGPPSIALPAHPAMGHIYKGRATVVNKRQ